MDTQKEICPICLRWIGEMNVCPSCMVDIDEKFKKEKKKGRVPLVTKGEYIEAKAEEVLAVLQKELKEAKSLKEQHYPDAYEEAKAEMKKDGALFVDGAELNKMAGKIFDLKLGTKAKARDVFGAINYHPERIASLQRRLSKKNIVKIAV